MITYIVALQKYLDICEGMFQESIWVSRSSCMLNAAISGKSDIKQYVPHVNILNFSRPQDRFLGLTLDENGSLSSAFVYFSGIIDAGVIGPNDNLEAAVFEGSAGTYDNITAIGDIGIVNFRADSRGNITIGLFSHINSEQETAYNNITYKINVRVNGIDISSDSKANHSSIRVVECLENPQQTKFVVADSVAETL